MEVGKGTGIGCDMHSGCGNMVYWSLELQSQRDLDSNPDTTSFCCMTLGKCV